MPPTISVPRTPKPLFGPNKPRIPRPPAIPPAAEPAPASALSTMSPSVVAAAIPPNRRSGATVIMMSSFVIGIPMFFLKPSAVSPRPIFITLSPAKRATPFGAPIAFSPLYAPIPILAALPAAPRPLSAVSALPSPLIATGIPNNGSAIIFSPLVEVRVVTSSF